MYFCHSNNPQKSLMEQIQTKLYNEMTPDEQLRYVTDFTSFIDKKLPALEHIGDAWEQSTIKDFETGLRLLNAFQFARDFVDKAVRYGDYSARVHRIRVYVEKIKNEIAKGLSLKGADGHTYALVAPSLPARRRGRPTKEEAAARLRGIDVPKPTDPEMEKQIVIARLMGIDVQVSNVAPREKNNAELAAERAARQAAYDQQNPSLFPALRQAQGPSGSPSGAQTTVSVLRQARSTGSGQAQEPSGGQSPMADIYTDRIFNDRLHLSDLAWLCSDELKARIEQVRAQRTVFGSASERAKLLAEQGADPKTIAPYARQAEEAREAFESTYAAVDEALAIQYKRLSIDQPYIERFKARFKGVDLEKVLYITHPYYEKLKSPELDLRIRTLIEQDSPEYAARMKAEEEKKQEVTDILRYLKRRDKMATDVRLKSAKEVKFPRLVELIGEKEAMNYYPLITYIEEENRKLHEADGKEKVSEAGNSQEKDKDTKFKKPAKKKSDKQKPEKKKR